MYKRIILITIDCLRQDHLKLYSYHKNLAPNIEKFAKNAFVFDNAIVNGSNTPSSFYALFTSKIPTSNGYYAPISKQDKKLAEILQKNKIKTGGIHSNPHLGIFCNYNVGFDYFLDIFKNAQFSLKKKFYKIINSILKILEFKVKFDNLKNKMLTILRLNKKIYSFETKKIDVPYSNAKIIVTETINWLKNNYKSDFFLWIHFMDVHRPYNPPLEFLRMVSDMNFTEQFKIYLNILFSNYKNNPYLIKKINERDISGVNALYDAEIYYVDYYLGVLFSYLKNIKIFDILNIIITADHGQALFDHPQLSHGVTLYDELLKVPLIIKPDFEINGQKRIKQQVQLLDLSPTILDIFSLAKENDFQGTSLISLMKGENNDIFNEKIISIILHHKGYMFTAFTRGMYKYFILISIRTTSWKMIYDDETKKIELYNIKKDPFELNDLSNETSEMTIQVKKDLFNYIRPYIKEYEFEMEIIKKSINNDLLKFL